MSDVSVIGTGAMGSALVEGLKASGARVTVWNRTKEKAEALCGARVRLAESVGEALMSSPLTIMSVSDHEVARTLIEGMRQGLEGRVVASTSFVTPDQAQELGKAMRTAGGAYLDLEIAALPRQVRSRAGVFLVSGERAAFEAHREGLERIGRVTYVSSGPASAYLSGMAVQLAYLPLAVGLLQGARIAESQDFSADGFRKAVLDFYPFHIEQLLDRITTQSESEPEVDFRRRDGRVGSGVRRSPAGHEHRLRNVRRAAPAVHRCFRSGARGDRLDVHRRARCDALRLPALNRSADCRW